MRPPLVSVILPIWNPNPDWLNAAIASAYQESLCRIEVILVDDGSDGSPYDWLSPTNAERVHVIRIHHQGVSCARNVGLEKCQGEFIRFLDGDDVFLPESTSKLLELTTNDKPIVAYGSTILCDEYLQARKTVRSRLSGFIHFQVAVWQFKVYHTALLIPRDVIEQIGGFDERLIVQGDWDFMLRLSEVAEFRGTQVPVYLYRLNENSWTGRGDKRREAIKSTILIIKGYLKRHPELKNTNKERMVRAYAQFQIAKFRNPGNSLRSTRFWKAATLDPLRGAGIFILPIVSALGRAMKRIITVVANK